MTTDRERAEATIETGSCSEELTGLRQRVAELQRENEALRKEIDSREAFWAELKKRLPELERENEALRADAEKWRTRHTMSEQELWGQP